MEDRNRKVLWRSRVTALQIGQRRIEEKRVCRVPDCGKAIKDFSTYCKKHQMANMKFGHPTIPLNFRLLEDRQRFAKIGRFVLRAIIKTPEDQRAWDRVMQGIESLRSDKANDFDETTLWRRRKNWTRKALAKAYLASAIQTKLLQEDRDKIETAVGAIAWMSLGNTIPMTKRQTDGAIRKIIGRLMLHFISFRQIEDEPRRKVKITSGVQTETGRLITDLIEREFGAKFWRDIDLIAAVELRERVNGKVSRDNETLSRTSRGGLKAVPGRDIPSAPILIGEED
ncbi:hypothetical protein ACFQ3C_05035 [Seohaeicola saemankumensis]|uniref:Uncharacterized protein n=1 Tax=Seohaeicola saemankumensis TaxID=481181 RepID=A0ABW3TA44_9RHOB